MKRLVCFLLLIAMVISLAFSGCAVDPVQTTTANQSHNPTEGKDPTEGNTPTDGSAPTEGTHTGNYGIDFSDNDGWALNTNSAFFGVVVDDGYYYLAEDMILRYLDMNVGTSVVLCSKIPCSHSNGSCEAFLSDYASQEKMFWWNDGLYYIESNGHNVSLLMRRNATGMAEEVVARLGESLMGSDREVSVAEFVIADGWMYYLAETFAVMQLADGSLMSTKDKSYLCRVNLNSGKDSVLVEYSDGYLRLVTARADAMIYVEYDTPEFELQLDDQGMLIYPDGYYEDLAKSPANLMRWDEATGQSTLLLERTNETLDSVKAYGGNVIFVEENHEHRYAYDLQTGQLSELDMISGALINETYMLHFEGGVHSIKNMKTGKTYPIELGGGTARVHAVSDKWLILRVRIEGIDTVYYIPMDAIADGIQRSDATAFPPNK